MGLNKEVKEEIKEGFIKKTAKKGAGYVKDETKKFTNMKDIMHYSGMIKSMMSFLNPFKEKDEKNKREETFENAMERLNLTEESLKKSFEYHRFYFYLGVFLCFGSLFFGAYLLIALKNYWSIGPIVACVAIGLSQMFTGSFRTYQINTRQLCDVKTWFDNGIYIPKKFKNDKELKLMEKQKSKEVLKKLTK